MAKFDAPSGKMPPNNPHTLFMMGGGHASGVRVQHPQDAVGTGCCGAEKQQPCALQIRDMRNPVQEDLVFSRDVTQLRIDELTVSVVPNTFMPRSSAGKVGSPPHTWLQRPNLRLAQMDFDAGTSPELTLDQFENGDSSNSFQRGRENNAGINASPCSLPSPWGRRRRCRVRHAKCTWKEKCGIGAHKATRCHPPSLTTNTKSKAPMPSIESTVAWSSKS